MGNKYSAKVTLPTAASCAASSGPTASSSIIMTSSSTVGAAGAVTTGMSTSSNGTAMSGRPTIASLLVYLLFRILPLRLYALHEMYFDRLYSSPVALSTSTWNEADT